MRYIEKTFSAPAGPSGISQREWDYATLSAAEFAAKYGAAGLERVMSPMPAINPDAHLGAVEP